MNSKKIAVSIFLAFLLVGMLSMSTATASGPVIPVGDKKQFVASCVDGVKLSVPSLSNAAGKNYCVCAFKVAKKSSASKPLHKKSDIVRLQALTNKKCADRLS